VKRAAAAAATGLFVGSALAWAATGRFGLGAGVGLLALGAALTWAVARWRPAWALWLAPLLTLLAGSIQAWRWVGGCGWAALLLAVLTLGARWGRPAWAVVYLGLAAVVAGGGLPIWSLAVALTLPQAWEQWRTPSPDRSAALVINYAVLLAVGALIQGIAR